MNRTRVTERGQITIPKHLRERLGIEPGTELEFDAEGGWLVARKAEPRDRDPFDAVYGVLELPEGTDGTLRRLRGKADAA
ncbi:MAG: AbrB/MazE/SpoVT family DNA-binding domain-containing protein [Actinomycetota bacterium]